MSASQAQNNAKIICSAIKTAATTEDFVEIQCLISNLFTINNQSEIEEAIRGRENFYIIAFSNLLNNPTFLGATGKVAEQHRSFKRKYRGDEFTKDFREIEIKNKKTIFTALSTTTALLVNSFPYLTQKNIEFAATVIGSLMRKLRETLGNQYSSEEIFYILSTTINKKFYSKARPVTKINNLNHFFEQQRVAGYLTSSILVQSFGNSRLCSLFKSIEKRKLEGKFSLSSITKLAQFIDDQKHQRRRGVELLDKPFKNKELVEIFFENLEEKNARNSFNLIEITIKEFTQPKPGEGVDLPKPEEAKVRILLQNTSKTLNAVENYGRKNFKAFSGKIIPGDDIEWPNKIFINCCKLLGALQIISQAKDGDWKISAAANELYSWMTSIHQILNKHDLEDGWDGVAKFLNQETNKIEWKSTFFTPIEIGKGGEGVGRKIFEGIIKTILGMINTEGGVILVGLIENPEEISPNLKENILKKRNRAFFDVSSELAENKMDIDGLKRKIQDSLKKETAISTDRFNNLWKIEPISLKSDDGMKNVTIFKIEIFKSDSPIFSVDIKSGNDRDVENIWVSLLKRADARTIRVDPRSIFDKEKLTS